MVRRCATLVISDFKRIKLLYEALYIRTYRKPSMSRRIEKLLNAL